MEEENKVSNQLANPKVLTASKPKSPDRVKKPCQGSYFLIPT